MQATVGGVLSNGITSNDHDELLPASSVAVMVTRVVVSKVDPTAGDWVRVSVLLQLSVAFAKRVKSSKIALHDAFIAVHCVPGQLMAGAD